MQQDNNTIEIVKRKVVEKAIDAFGDKVNRIVLYGSFARGDFTSESDIDVMLLLNCKHEELPLYRKKVAQIASEISLNDDVELSLMIEDIFTYEKWLDTLPFYQNVKKDGVVLYG